MKKTTIKEYRNLYPVTLYVDYLGNSANLNEIFNFYNRIDDWAELKNEGTIYIDRDINGATFLVLNKITGRKGVLILLDKDCPVSTQAHESIHYADAVFDYLRMNGEGYDAGNEHYAYLVTWCFEQLENFRNAERDKKR